MVWLYTAIATIGLLALAGRMQSPVIALLGIGLPFVVWWARNRTKDGRHR